MITFEFQGNKKLKEVVTSSRLNAILQELRRIRPLAGRGVNVDYTGGGARISAIEQNQSSSAVERRRPWDIYVKESSGEESKTYTLKVQPGTITGVLASNWQDEFSASDESVYYGIATISTDGQQISGVTISISSTLPSAATPELFALPTSTPLLFGMFYNGKSYRLFVEDNPWLSPVPWITQEKPSNQPGQLPYNIYYALAK